MAESTYSEPGSLNGNVWLTTISEILFKPESLLDQDEDGSKECKCARDIILSCIEVCFSIIKLASTSMMKNLYLLVLKPRNLVVLMARNPRRLLASQ